MFIRESFAWARILAMDYFCAGYAREQKRLLRGSIASSLVLGLIIDCVFELSIVDAPALLINQGSF